MSYPEIFARFYDLIYKKIRDHKDEDYYLNKILNNTGPVLEIGTGTGRFFRQALKAGADIYGIDNSEYMLSVLKSGINKSEHSRVFLMDARDIDLGMRFDLIIAPFRVFQHCLSISDQISFLNSAAAHLKDDGLFIFDLFAPNLEILQHGLSKILDFEGEDAQGNKVERYTSLTSDISTQVNDVEMLFRWQQNGEWQEYLWKLKMRYFFYFELIHLLERSDLELEAIYGDFEGSALRNDSKEFIVHCRRKS